MLSPKMMRRMIIAFLACVIFCCGLFIGKYMSWQNETSYQTMYVEVEDAFLAAGYEAKSADLYEKKHHGLTEQIRLDYINNKVLRNGFAVDIKDAFLCYATCLLRKDKMEDILLKEKYAFPLYGTRYAPLIAHAGGGYRGNEHNMTYTNTHEAIQQNYELGHRFFEVDFYFTDDKKFVGLHPNDMPPQPISNAELWVRQQIESKGLRPVTLSSLLDLMLIQRDMFLVTDTKAFLFNDEEQDEQFNFLYNEIMRRDDTLIDRVIPQFYSPQMMQRQTILHHFPSVIFTDYAVNTTNEEILKLLDEYSNIQMVTTYIGGERVRDEEFVAAIQKRKKKVSVHTVNEPSVFVDAHYAKVESYYTDFLVPHDWQTRKAIRFD